MLLDLPLREWLLHLLFLLSLSSISSCSEPSGAKLELMTTIRVQKRGILGTMLLQFQITELIDNWQPYFPQVLSSRPLLWQLVSLLLSAQWSVELVFSNSFSSLSLAHFCTKSMPNSFTDGSLPISVSGAEFSSLAPSLVLFLLWFWAENKQKITCPTEANIE